MGIHLHPKSPNPHGFMSKVYVLCDVTIVRTVFLALRGKLRSYEACMATTMTKGMTVLRGDGAQKSSRAIETLHFVLQSMHRSKMVQGPTSQGSMLVATESCETQHMNMNPGPQHTDAHGRGKK